MQRKRRKTIQNWCKLKRKNNDRTLKLSIEHENFPVNVEIETISMEISKMAKMA